MEIAVDGLVFEVVFDGIGAQDVVVDERHRGAAVRMVFDRDVRGDAAVRILVERTVFVAVAVVDGLHAAAAGRVVLAGREFHLGVVGHRTDRLDEALAEGTGTCDRGAAQVLQGTGRNLGGGSGVAVDHHEKGHQRIDGRLGGAVFPVHLGHAALGRHHEGSLRHEERDQADGFVHHAAAIVAQVDDQAFRAGFLETEQRFLELFGHLGGIAGELDVADVIFVDTGIGDVGHVDPLADHRYVHRVFRTALDEFELHLRAGLALHPSGTLLGCFLIDRDAVDLDNRVAGLKAVLGGRRAFVRLDDADAFTRRLADQRTDATVVSSGQQLKVFSLIFRNIHRIRIERGEHRPHACDDHLVEIDRIDVGLRQLAQDGILHLQALSQFEILALRLRFHRHRCTQCRDGQRRPKHLSFHLSS